MRPRRNQWDRWVLVLAIAWFLLGLCIVAGGARAEGPSGPTGWLVNSVDGKPMFSVLAAPGEAILAPCVLASEARARRMDRTFSRPWTAWISKTSSSLSRISNRVFGSRPAVTSTAPAGVYQAAWSRIR
jgi:hypothetical protein